MCISGYYFFMNRKKLYSQVIPPSMCLHERDQYRQYKTPKLLHAIFQKSKYLVRCKYQVLYAHKVDFYNEQKMKKSARRDVVLYNWQFKPLYKKITESLNNYLLIYNITIHISLETLFIRYNTFSMQLQKMIRASMICFS